MKHPMPPEGMFSQELLDYYVCENQWPQVLWDFMQEKGSLEKVIAHDVEDSRLADNPLEAADIRRYWLFQLERHVRAFVDDANDLIGDPYFTLGYFEG